MDELQQQLTKLKAELKSLTAKKLSERTPDDKMKIAELRLQIANCKTAIEKMKFVVAREKAAEAKDKAILKNLHENNITTENQVKALLSLREVCAIHGIHSAKELRQCLDSVRNNISSGNRQSIPDKNIN